MKNMTYDDKVYLLGRSTVLLALIAFASVPFGLSMAFNSPIDWPVVIEATLPIFLTFAISAVCENLSYAPIIGPGALYMACVTGNVSNMKIPAAVNAMEVAGVEPGSDKANVISIIAVAASTFVTTAVLFLGMMFLAPLFEPVYNNEFLRPAFDNVVPALFGAILFPYIAKYPKQAIPPIVLPIILILIVGRTFFSTYQSYIMMLVIILSGVYSYMLHKKGMI